MNTPLDPETKSLLTGFFAMAKEQNAATPEGLAALKRLVKATVHQDSGQVGVIRSFLLSLYNGENPRVDLSEVMRLDWALRKDLCAVILTVGNSGFADSDIRDAYEAAGDKNAEWFLGTQTV